MIGAKTLLLTWVLLSCTEISSAQNSRIDSLKSVLDEAPDDTSRYNLMYEIFYEVFEKDDSESKKWANKIISIIPNLEAPGDQGSAYSLLGDYYGDTHKYSDSKSSYEKALRAYTKAQDSLGVANTHFNLGITYDYIGDYVMALEHYQKSLDFYEKKGDKIAHADVLSNIGVLYSNQLDYHNSIKYFQKSIDIRREYDSQAAIILELGNLGAVYGDHGALENDTTKLNLSLTYYRQALELADESEDKSIIVWIKSNMGLLYIDLGDYEKALEILKGSLLLSKSINDKIGESTAYGNIGEVHYKRKNYSKALENYNKAYLLALQTNDKQLIQESYESFANCYAQLGDYQKAYSYHKKFKATQDSLYNIEKNVKFNELMALYDSEKKEQEIKDLQRDKLFNDLEIERQKAETRLYLVIAAAMFILAIVILIFYIIQRRNKLQLERINADLIKSQKELSVLNQTKDRFFAIIAHDLRGAITSFQGIGQVIKNHLLKRRLERITMVADRIDSSARQLNGLLDNLLNWAVTQLGQVPFDPRKMHLKKVVDNTIEIFRETAQAKNIHLRSDIPDDIFVHADQNGLSVVLRNLLNNAFKFTEEGGTVTINASAINGQANITVSDTGIGISDEKMKTIFQLDDKKSTAGTIGEKGTGLGLVLCKEFIKLHDGELTAESEIGKGSTFKFSIPRATKEVYTKKVDTESAHQSI